LAESLLQTAGMETEKEREANDVESDSWCREGCGWPKCSGCTRLMPILQ